MTDSWNSYQAKQIEWIKKDPDEIFKNHFPFFQIEWDIFFGQFHSVLALQLPP